MHVKDEFAKEYFMFPSDDENRTGHCGKKKLKRKNKKTVIDNDPSNLVMINPNESPLEEGEESGIQSINNDNQVGDEDEDSNDDSSEEIDYRIQYVLDSRSLTPTEWQLICGCMDTREVTRGSVLKQPDSEFYDNSPIIVEKFLIKWVHASFLHISWETEKDLLDLCGVSAKNHIKKFRLRSQMNIEIFEDLRKGELYPPQYIQVDRVLDTDDSCDSINPLNIDWMQAVLPPFEVSKSSDKTKNDTSDDNESNETEEPVTTTKKSRSSSKSSSKSTSYLHGDNCWLSIKWEGQSYSDITVEHVSDLRNAKIDYENQLRDFYRREQQTPGVGLRGKCVRSLYKAAQILESPQPPAFKAGTLRDYQWEGVRWMLFNWSQKRNSILADEMGLGE